jgi:hypothetical protein
MMRNPSTCEHPFDYNSRAGMSGNRIGFLPAVAPPAHPWGVAAASILEDEAR